MKGLPVIPEAVDQSRHMIESFITSSHHIVHVLLSCLSSLLGQNLGAIHREGYPSNCGLKLESVPLEARREDVPPSEHTDQGSLTLLFCPQYTTEIQVPGTKEWGFIVPKSGCAIVNIADSLEIFSNRELHSCLHRVGQPTPGAGERHCILYYLRPEGSEDGIGVATT